MVVRVLYRSYLIAKYIHKEEYKVHMGIITIFHARA
jgi:hypothetical protein